MAGRGPQTFKKRQKEQARKERQEEKRVKRLERAQGIRPPDGDENGEEFTAQLHEPWPGDDNGTGETADGAESSGLAAVN